MFKINQKHTITLDFAPTSVAFSPNGPFMAIGGFEEDRVFIYELSDTPKLVHTLKMAWASCPPNSIVWHQEKLYVVGDGSTKCYIWDMSSLKLLNEISLSNSLSQIKSISLTEDKLLIAGQTKYGEEHKPDLHIFDLVGKPITALSSGSFLEVAGWNGSKIWSVFNSYTDDQVHLVIREIDLTGQCSNEIHIFDGETKDIRIDTYAGIGYITANVVNQDTSVIAKINEWSIVQDDMNISAFVPLNDNKLILDVFNGNYFEVRALDLMDMTTVTLNQSRKSGSSLGIASDHAKFLAITRDNQVLVFEVC